MLGSPQQGQQTPPAAQPAGQPPAKQPPAKQPPAKQEPQEVDPGLTKFTGTVTEVILPVTVTDNKGRFIDNLEQKDFRILDDGRAQRIRYFNHEKKQPTVIGFLVDMSNNSTIHWQNYKEAVKEMVWGLLPNDKNYTGYLISFSNKAELIVNTTSDPDKLTSQVDRMKPGGGAALFDAVKQACTDRQLIPGEPFQPRRVIVVFANGHDSASEYTIDQVIELAQKNLVTIYGVSTAAYGMEDPDRDQLEKLAHQTGGMVWYPLDNPYSEVSGFLSQPSDEGNYALHVGTGGYAAAINAAIYKAVGALEGEIQTQYILRYNPEFDAKSAMKEKHQIKVEIPSLPDGSYTARTRPDYYPNRIGQ
jgi:Ca-activated chloride channel homolog